MSMASLLPRPQQPGRLPDWEARLWGVVARAELDNRPFEHGVNDCCLFVAQCVDAMTGSDYVERVLSAYDSRDAAVDLLVAHGTMRAGMAHFLGPETGGFARLGDVVVMPSQAEPVFGAACGISMGRLKMVTVGPLGVAHLRVLPRDAAVWRVG